jgi:hypothetical protein
VQRGLARIGARGIAACFSKEQAAKYEKATALVEAHTLTLTLTHTHSHNHTLTHSHILTHSRTLTHTHTHLQYRNLIHHSAISTP